MQYLARKVVPVCGFATCGAVLAGWARVSRESLCRCQNSKAGGSVSSAQAGSFTAMCLSPQLIIIYVFPKDTENTAYMQGDITG